MSTANLFMNQPMQPRFIIVGETCLVHLVS